MISGTVAPTYQVSAAGPAFGGPKAGSNRGIQYSK
jgi:hypothetical protein